MLRRRPKSVLLLVVVVSLLYLSLSFYRNKEYQREIKQPQTFLNQSKQYIKISWIGRLGNLMFIYASLLGIANRNGMGAIVPYDLSLHEVFDTNITSNQFNSSTLKFHKYGEFGRKACTYDYNTENLRNISSTANIYLIGYFQSWRYFTGIEDEVKTHFTINEKLKAQAQEYLEKSIPATLKNKDFTKVGVHVRRSDMLRPGKIEFGYTAATPSYLQKAMAFFRARHKSVLFVVCSDDIEWCKQNIKGNDVIFSDSGSYKIDMALLVSCKHTVMTVGSFGWWAAWLTNGTTVYFKDWPRPSSDLDSQVNKKDYFPSKWIPM